VILSGFPGPKCKFISEKWEIRVQFMTAHFATTVEESAESKLQVLPV